MGAILVIGIFAACARNKLRVALLALITFHLHLVCDFFGSRGPTPNDLWPILYFAPFRLEPLWVWKGQWQLDGWQNKLFTIALLLWIFQIAITHDTSVLRIFNQKAEGIFVQVIQGWWLKLRRKHLAASPP